MCRKILAIRELNDNLAYSLMGLIIVVCSFGCIPKPKAPTDYGTPYNHVRDSLGIKQIPVEWADIGTREEDMILYTNPDIDSTNQASKAYYGGKVLIIKNDSLMYEWDNFGIVRFPVPEQGITLELLTVFYYYHPNENNRVGWRYSYYINEHPQSDTLYSSHAGPTFKFKDGRQYNSTGNPIEMTRADVDSILGAWGMTCP